MAVPRNSPPEARFPACAGMTEAGAIGAPLDILLQQIINGLVQGSVYALVALGYTMVYGILGLINFAHGEVVMIGAMIALTALQALLAAAFAPVLAVLLSLLVAMAVCMALGYSIERIAYRP